MIDNYTEDYIGDHNIKKLAYIGINAMNYLYARRMLHSISREIGCDDPIETIMNADKLAAAIDYNNMEAGGLRHQTNYELTNDEIDFVLARI